MCIVFAMANSSLRASENEITNKNFPIKIKFQNVVSDEHTGCYDFELNTVDEFRGKKLDSFGIVSRTSTSGGENSFLFNLKLDKSNSTYLCMPLNQLQDAIVFSGYGYDPCEGDTYSFQLDLSNNLGKFQDYTDEDGGRSNWFPLKESHNIGIKRTK